MLYSKLPETMYSTISHCRVCGNPNLDPVLHLGTQALTGVFPRDRESPVPVGPLELVKCRDDGSRKSCGLVQLRHSFQPGAMYGMNYGYRSGLNQSMVDHLNAIARKAKRLAGAVPGDLVLDIGSNDGTLLHAMDAPGLELVGMDPTGVKFQQYYAPHIRLIPEFFSAATFRKEFGRRSAKLITSIAMFYDLEAPLQFAREISEVLADDGIWMFEQSYLPAMLACTSYDTICHEHLEYYTLQQMLWIAERAGLRILDVELNNANGGSFCVTAAKAANGRTADEAAIASIIREEEEGGFSQMAVYSRFAERVLRHRDDLRAFLQEEERKGEVIFGCGASTKGNVLLQFCGLTSQQIPFISDVNPDKFGSFTPRTLIPIVSEHEARSRKPDGFLVLPWHFRDAIMTRESEFLAGGGKLIFPLPKIEVVTSEESSSGRF